MKKYMILQCNASRFCKSHRFFGNVDVGAEMNHVLRDKRNIGSGCQMQMHSRSGLNGCAFACDKILIVGVFRNPQQFKTMSGQKIGLKR